ncbi:MAG: lipid-binding protein [Christiangramia sp.]|nr:lipid-binding protein [Christiangramia sp.]
MESTLELLLNNNILIMKILKFFLFLTLVIAYSCSEDGYADYDPGQTKTKELSGEWFIARYDSEGNPVDDYHLWSTYNTVENNNQLWIDDDASSVELKTKVESDLNNLTFSGSPNSPELYNGGTVTVKNGKVIKNGGRGYSSGAVVDSIYFEVEFASEPGVIYKFGGHERTGFDEDDHPTIL